MDWDSYRSLCDRGDVLSRYLLAATIDLLAAADELLLVQELQQVLAQEPLPKPADHRAGAAADFFVAEIELPAARRILEVVVAARAAGLRTGAGRDLGGFPEAWQEYLDWQTGVHPRSARRE
ncbi:MAG: hypothetical protein JJT88_05080 [Gammaproteobacteria bacterium]|nr:hypothetical protein [Gammaproteobacteria bacterium]